jgi:hypothetical protein
MNPHSIQAVEKLGQCTLQAASLCPICKDLLLGTEDYLSTCVSDDIKKNVLEEHCNQLTPVPLSKDRHQDLGLL